MMMANMFADEMGCQMRQLRFKRKKVLEHKLTLT